MNILFHKMRTGRKGQIVAVLTVALITFLIAAFLAVNLGKSKIQGVKVKNGAQAAVLGGGSAACVLLNSIANVNDQMILNFVGFTLMIQFMLVSWIVDYVKTLIKAFSSLTPFNWTAGIETMFATLTICITTATMALLIVGADKVGNQIKKMIDELNEKVPKSSRDSARQYGFSNAGVDEPKIARKDMDPWAYSLIETGFDKYMRLLPALNRGDKNYGTSTLEYSWNDSRTGHIVSNKVAVTVTPVEKVPFKLVTFGEVGAMSGQINAYLSTQKLGFLGPVIKFGVTIAPIIIALIWSTVPLFAVLGGIMLAIGGVETGYASMYWSMFFSCCWWPCFALCWCAAYAAYYTYAAIWQYISGGIAIAAAIAFLIVYANTPPQKIPCFYWETRFVHHIYSTINRTTSPSSINYGIYTTSWPGQSSSAHGAILGGTIFPPVQEFDIELAGG